MGGGEAEKFGGDGGSPLRARAGEGLERGRWLAGKRDGAREKPLARAEEGLERGRSWRASGMVRRRSLLARVEEESRRRRWVWMARVYRIYRLDAGLPHRESSGFLRSRWERRLDVQIGNDFLIFHHLSSINIVPHQQNTIN